MSLYTVVSRGMAGRLGPRPIEGDTRTGPAEASAIKADEVEAGEPAVRLPGASMRVLETGLALTAIATAILIGVGR